MNNGEKSQDPILSDIQKRIVSYALTALAIVGILFFILGFLWILRSFVTAFSQVLWPLAIAAILATLLKPLVAIIQRRLKLTRNKAIALMYVVVVVAFSGFLWFLITLVDEQIIAFLKGLPDMLQNMGEWFRTTFPQATELISQYMGGAKFDDLLQQLSAHIQTGLTSSINVLKSGGAEMMKVFAWATALAVVPIYLFFLLQTDRDFSKDLSEQFNFLPNKLRDDIVFLVREFVSILVAFFRGQLIIALIMSALYATGFGIVGLEFGILLGLMLGLLNIVPYLGTILGLATVLPIAYLQTSGGLFFDSGGWGLVAGCLVVFGLVQLVEGYLLTPRIMNQQTGLHPMVIIIAIFFWGVALNGILGMILAIPLTAFFVVAWRLIRVKYLPELTGEKGRGEA